MKKALKEIRDMNKDAKKDDAVKKIEKASEKA